MLDPIDRLNAAYAAAGLPPLPPAGDVASVLDELRAAIAPLRLPPGVERCWRRIAPHASSLAPSPRLDGPARALFTWRRYRAAPRPGAPAVLFPVCREQGSLLFGELDDGGGSAGTCFAWQARGAGFELVFASFAAYLDLWATMVELEEFAVTEVSGRRRYSLDPTGRWRDAQRVRLGAAMPLPRYGEQVTFAGDPRYWPSHWLRSNSLVPAARRSPVVVSDLVDLVRRAQAGQDAAGTVRARVTGLVGSAKGTQVVIDDGTARVDLWCPATVTAPAMHRVFEFDIVVRAASPRRTEDLSGSIRDLMWSGADDPAGAAPLRRLSDVPHAAEATAIRRVD